jgi:hypothetical protein
MDSRWIGLSTRRVSTAKLNAMPSMRGGECGQAATLSRGYFELALGWVGSRVAVRTMRSRIREDATFLVSSVPHARHLQLIAPSSASQASLVERRLVTQFLGVVAPKGPCGVWPRRSARSPPPCPRRARANRLPARGSAYRRPHLDGASVLADRDSGRKLDDAARIERGIFQWNPARKLPESISLGEIVLIPTISPGCTDLISPRIPR